MQLYTAYKLHGSGNVYCCLLVYFKNNELLNNDGNFVKVVSIPVCDMTKCKRAGY